MKYLEKIGNKNLIYISLIIVVLISIVAGVLINRPITGFRNNVYVVVLGFISLMAFDSGIKVLILKIKGNLLSANTLLTLVFLSLFSFLLLVFIQSNFSFQIIITSFLLLAVIRILNINLKESASVYSLFSFFGIFISSNLIFLVILIPFIIVYIVESRNFDNLLNFLVRKPSTIKKEKKIISKNESKEPKKIKKSKTKKVNRKRSK